MHHFMWVTHIFNHLDPHYYYVYSALTTIVVLALVGIYVRVRVTNIEAMLVPSPKVSLINVLELAVESLMGLFASIMGPKHAKRHFPFLASIFIYIFTTNIMGVIPGFPPGTDNINMNMGIALCVFLYFNFWGLKENGLNYVKHLLGPFWWLAPFIGAIEIFGLMLRPATLSLRLLGNITGDHLVLGVFSELVPWVIPVVFMAFGIFVAFIQAFVFTLLSTIYVGLAVEDMDHH